MLSNSKLRHLDLFGAVMERLLELALTAMDFGPLDIGGQVIMLSMWPLRCVLSFTLGTCSLSKHVGNDCQQVNGLMLDSS